MTGEPLVSVVIPNYNYGEYLAEAIESALRQSYRRLEVLVSDDGSTDDSKRVVASFGGAVRWLEQENRGVSCARNRAIEASSGEIVAFLDADDSWHPDKIRRQVKHLLSQSFGMVYSGLEIVGPEGDVRGRMCQGLSGRVLRDLALLEPPGVPGSGSSAIVPREVLAQVGSFDVELSTSADWDLCRRIACRYEIGFVAEPLVRYRVHEKSMHRNVELFERDMLRAFDKMFEDDSAREAQPLFRRARGRLYWTLAGSFFRRGRWAKSARYLSKSLFFDPALFGRVATYPLRRMGLGSASSLTPESCSNR